MSHIRKLLPNDNLPYKNRLCMICYGFADKLIPMLLQNKSIVVYKKKRTIMIRFIMNRVLSKWMTDVRDKFAKEAEELCASGQCAAAAVALKLAAYLGHLPSRALMANMMIGGREGVAENHNGAFELVEEGARLGCHHCQGIMAECYRLGCGCVRDAARSLELARKSSEKGSRYGQYVLGWLYRLGIGGVGRNPAQALALYRLAAVLNHDGAQFILGGMYRFGDGVAQDFAEALRLFQLAAAQGNPTALYNVAFCHEWGLGVPASNAEAIRWYRRAQAAGHPNAADALQTLRA